MWSNDFLTRVQTLVNSVFSKGCWENWVHIHKNELGPLPYTIYIKINSK